MTNDAPEKIFINGDVIPMTAPGQRCQAVAVKRGKISDVGSSAEIESIAGPQTEVYDLKARTMLPGFIDPHSHFLSASESLTYKVDLTSPPIGDVRNIADLQAKLKERAASLAPGGWVLGYGYDDTLLKEMQHPTADDLDKVSTDHPIFITHVSVHLAAANSLALKMGGVDAFTPNPPGGFIRRKTGSNQPNGVLEEQAAFKPITRHIPERDSEEWLHAIARNAEAYLAKGVTTANDGKTMPAMYRHLLAAHERGMLKIRVQVWPSADYSRDAYPGPTSGAPITPDRMVTMGALKITQDGSIQGYTAYLSNPYYKMSDDQPQEHTYRGYPISQRRDFIDRVIKFHREGWQIATHGNGDDAIQNIIDAVEEAQKVYPRDDARHVIVHCQTVREDQLERMKRLGMIASFFPPHIYYWGDRHYERFLGPFRAERIDPCQSALERGIVYTSHNDTNVTPIDPLLCVWTAVNRVTHGGRLLGESQKIPVYDALKSVTCNAAYQFHEEGSKGSIVPGKLADLVILDENPLEVDPMRIKDIAVKATMVGGEIVWGGLD